MKITSSILKLKSKGNAFEYNSPYYFNVRDFTITEFAEFCSSGGFFKAALYDLDKAKANVVEKKMGKNVVPFGKGNAHGANVLALDFDSIEQTPTDVVEVFAESGLLPNFMYWSASQEPRKVLALAENSRKTPSTLYISQSDGKNTTIFSSGLDQESAGAETPHHKDGYNFRLV